MSEEIEIPAGQLREVSLSPMVGMAFSYVPAGEFLMGSREDNSNEEPVHRVRIAHGYWLGETPVTQVQFGVWAAVAGVEHTHRFPDQPDHPAETLDWRQAVRFCAWLTGHLTGEVAFPPGASLACLPTEAEWEYACRAGSDTDYYAGDGEAALATSGWFGENGPGSTQPVGLLKPNRWGLHDMHGNVDEWCHDPWDASAYRTRLDGEVDPGQQVRAHDYGPDWKRMLDDGRHRVFRGGSWGNTARWSRSACRGRWPPDVRFGSQGFRVCLAPGPAAAGAENSQPTDQAEAGQDAQDGGRQGRSRARPGPPEPVPSAQNI